MEQVIVRVISLPDITNGYVREDFDGNFNVYINANLSYDMQMKTLEHELMHIENEDFENGKCIREIE